MSDRPLKGLSVEEARTRILAGAVRMPVRALPLDQADGATLAEDILAIRDQPPFDASAMDGWAIQRADAVEGRVLSIAGESAAGSGYPRDLGAGEAVRIFTGAAVPQGADLVVIQEEAERLDGQVQLTVQPPEKSHVRPAGGDFRQGQRLLTAGLRLDPWRLSLAASAGRAQVLVSQRPRVAVLATGEELAAAGSEPGPFQIFESGSLGLAAMIRRWGGEPLRLDPAGDHVDAIASAVQATEADLVVTVGGASVGDHDLVKPALFGLGLVLSVETVNVRPGKPTWFGILGNGQRVLGLPGNPASAFVCAELFLRPLMSAMQGGRDGPLLEPAILAQDIEANGPREHWMRAILGPEGVVALPDQDSSLITVFAAANALVRRLPGAAALSAGSQVAVLRLSRG